MMSTEFLKKLDTPTGANQCAFLDQLFSERSEDACNRLTGTSDFEAARTRFDECMDKLSLQDNHAIFAVTQELFSIYSDASYLAGLKDGAALYHLLSPVMPGRVLS